MFNASPSPVLAQFFPDCYELIDLRLPAGGMPEAGQSMGFANKKRPRPHEVGGGGMPIHTHGFRAVLSVHPWIAYE